MNDEQAWQDIFFAFEHRQSLTGVVKQVVDGGVSVDLGVSAFLPELQFDLRADIRLQDWVGRSIEVEVVRYDRRTGDLVVSRRSLLEKRRDALKEKTLSRLKVGAVLRGKVTALAEYAAFVDLGGIAGMIHVSDLSPSGTAEPDALLSVGAEIDVVVIKYAPETMRIGLRLAPNSDR